ncbi:MAG: hypothetical protein FD180_2387 [Planctomycetota bacterium]|nr:MAG: hypothetical protein FD180_2387 [Planctomycetota bacterium]
MKRTHFVVKLESYEGKDTHLRCGDDDETQDYLFCVVVTKSDGTAEIVDTGYRSEDELRKAWPEI